VATAEAPNDDNFGGRSKVSRQTRISRTTAAPRHRSYRSFMPMYGRTVVNPDSNRSASVLATITVPFGLGWLLGAGWSVIAPPRGSRPDLLIL
jgi:hypothetical protein